MIEGFSLGRNWIEIFNGGNGENEENCDSEG